MHCNQPLLIIIEGNGDIRNRIDSERSSVEYSINIVSSPERFRIGERFTMQCKVTPQLRDVRFSWYKNGQLISNEESVSFERLTKEDLGSYKCVAKGTTENDMQIELEATAFQRASEFEYRKIGKIYLCIAINLY